MDWYLVIWVAGALLTWGSLTTVKMKRIITMPSLFYTFILLWPIIWVLASVAGLLELVFKFVGWAIGPSSRKQG